MDPMDEFELLKLIADDYSRSIIIGTFKRPLTRQEMSQEFDIPIAVVYRIARRLSDAGILQEGQPSRNTKRPAVTFHSVCPVFCFQLDMNGTVRVHAPGVNLES